jgi:hypothetical protein
VLAAFPGLKPDAAAAGAALPACGNALPPPD